MNERQSADAPLYSKLCDDPDLEDIVQLFVDEIPEHVAALWQAYTARDWEQLTHSVHQLRGAAGSYGFDEITPVAANLEELVRSQDEPDAILRTLETLTSYCGRIRGGAMPAESDESPWPGLHSRPKE